MIELELPPSPRAVPDARRALDAIGELVSSQTMDDIRLLVSELVTNSIRHAELRDPQTIELTVTVVGSLVRVEVRDAGAGFDLDEDPRDRTTGTGWGLYLVGRLADRWGVHRNGLTSVWFEVDRHRTGS